MHLESVRDSLNRMSPEFSYVSAFMQRTSGSQSVRVVEFGGRMSVVRKQVEHEERNIGWGSRVWLCLLPTQPLLQIR